MSDNTMDMQAQITLMKSYLDCAEKELTSLKNGKKVSWARVRSNLMKLKTLSHTIRKHVMEFSKSLPTKTRVKVKPTELTSIDDEELPPPPELLRETTTVTGDEVPKKKRASRAKKPIEKEILV